MYRQASTDEREEKRQVLYNTIDRIENAFNKNKNNLFSVMYLSNVYVLANIRILTVEESYGTLEDWAARCFKFSSSGEYSIPDYVAKTSKDIKNADRETEAKELKDRLNAINLGYLIQPKNKKKFEASKAVVAYIFCSQIIYSFIFFWLI